MRKAKRTILIAMLICAGFVPVCSAGTPRSKGKPKYPTVSELLGKYAETQDKLQSFIIKAKNTDKVFSSYWGGKRGEPIGKVYREGTGEICKFTEFSFDGARTSIRVRTWGNKSSLDEFVPENKASYLSNIWDGKSFTSYATDPRNDPGTLIIENFTHDLRNKIMYTRSLDSCATLGFFWGEDERIDSVLRKANNIFVKDQMETVNGAKCFVVDAVSKRGKYTVWIDPAHGYNIAKAEIRKTKGDLSHEKPLPHGFNQSSSFKVVDFEEVDGVWVPMEMYLTGRFEWGDGYFSGGTSHFKRTLVMLNPDHDALGSFVLDEVPNGATVHIAQAPGISYIWQDGKVVDEEGRVIMDCRPKKASGSAESKPKSAVRKRPSAWELLRRYAEQQAKVTAPRSEERVVHFPKDRSIGQLYLVERPLPKERWWNRVLVWERERLGEAQGDVRVPADKMLKLGVGKNAWKGGRPFAGLKPDDIQILTFYQYPHASDSVLKDVARLTGLEVLFLGHGRYTRRGVEHLTNLKYLKALQLPSNIRADARSCLEQFSSLEYLCLSGPDLTDAKLAAIRKMTWLTQLSIGGGSHIGPGLAHLDDFKSLRFLSLTATRNEHIDNHLAHIANLTELEKLFLRDTLVSDAGLVHLRKMSKLKRLDLFSNPNTGRITDAGMVHLKDLKSLEELRLPGGITDAGIEHLATLDSLKKVNLWGDGITDKSMATLAKMKSLEDLEISSRHVTDAGMEKLAQCPHLKFLNLGRCPVTDRGLAHLAKLKTLTKLSLRRTQVTGSGLTVLKELPLLTELNVHYIDFGEAGMAHLAGLKSLERLWIYAPEGKITDDDLADLSRVTSLKNLHISVHDSSQSLITDQGLAHLANLKALESLNIHSCQKVTDAGLRHFEGLASLKRLRLDFSRITKAGIARLKARIPGVEVIVQRPVPRRNARPELRNKPTRTMQRRSGRNEAKSREGR